MSDLSLNRRRLLLGLAAASTVAVAPVALGAAKVAVETPELLALAEKLDAAVAETAAARAQVRAVIAEWAPRWPSAPAAICRSHFPGSALEQERGLTGACILANGNPEPSRPDHRGADWLAYLDAVRANPDACHARGVQTSQGFLAEREHFLKAAKRRRSRGSKSGEADAVYCDAQAGLAGDKVALAAEYEAECARVRKASGYAEAMSRSKAAFDALAATVGAIIAAPAATMAGVMVKAQALAAWEAEPAHICHVESWKWGGAFASEVIRIAEQAA